MPSRTFAIAAWRSWAVAVVLVAGCGPPCREIAARRVALGSRIVGAEPHGRLRVPLARANAILAGSLAGQPLEKEIGPELLPSGLPLRLPALIARVREVRVVPAPPGRVGFAIRIEIRDPEREIATLALRAEVVPRVVRGRASTSLEISLGADSLLSVKPELGPDVNRQLTDALAGWLPDGLRRRVPRAVLERGARELARHLTGGVYRALRATLLARLGEVTRLRLGLPALPIARVTVRSPDEALEVDLVTDLPVRRGLTARAHSSDRIQLRLSGSAVAEIGNWAIEQGRLPRRYTRTLQPRPDGDYRPIFDWVGDRSRRPLVVHIFQERGGCSYFAVGMRPEISIAGGSLVAVLRDREIESTRGSVALQLAVWLKSLVSSAADTTRRIAATTQLEAGGRRFDTRVTRAELAGDELVLDLEITAASPVVPRAPLLRAQGDHRVDAGRPASGNVRRRERDRSQQSRHRGEGQWIHRAHAVHQAGHEMDQGQ